MIDHLVTIKIRQDAPTDSVKRIVAALKTLPAAIPEIVELTAGENFSPRSNGHHLGLFVRFHDRKGLATYATHPAHVEVVESLIKPAMEAIHVVDYET